MKLEYPKLTYFLIALAILVLIYYIYTKYQAHFADESKEYSVAKYLHEKNQLTYKNLKKRCPNCTNINYMEFKNKLKNNNI